VRRLRLALVGAALALPLTALSAGAQRPAERELSVGDLELEPSALELVEGFVENLLEERLTRGLVVGVSTASEQWVRGYGLARDDRAGAPHGDTRFELGSITKVFTGLLLTEAVARDEVALDTPLSSLLPEGIELEEAGGPIQLVHLATHSSGLPRMPPAFKRTDPAQPYAGHGEDATLRYLDQLRVRTLPGTRYAYSNLGVGVLGELLVGAADAKDYGELVEARLCEPLGLKATTAARPGASEDCAQGHDALLRPVDPWHFEVMAGAGCLRSTMNDVLRFGRSQLAPSTVHAQAQEAAFRPAQGSGPTMGLGWHLTPLGVLWHNGQTQGCHSFLALDRRAGLVVAVLSNASGPEPDLLGQGLLRSLTGRKPARPLEVQRAGKPTPERIERVLGEYSLGPLQPLVVSREGGLVSLQLGLQQPVRLDPEDDTGTSWFCRGVDARIMFDEGPGEAPGLTLLQNGLELRATRKRP